MLCEKQVSASLSDVRLTLLQMLTDSGIAAVFALARDLSDDFASKGLLNGLDKVPPK